MFQRLRAPVAPDTSVALDDLLLQLIKPMLKRPMPRGAMLQDFTGLAACYGHEYVDVFDSTIRGPMYIFKI